MNIKIYHNPRCTKSRQTLALLEKKTTDFKIIEYLKNPLSFDEIKEIIEDTIPQDKIDFGSWRGWSTFGLEETIKKTIEKKLELHRIPKD